MIELDFTTQFPGFDDYEKKYISLTKKTLKMLGYKFSPIISVTFTDNRYIHEINKEYRHIDRPTDVISFAFLDDIENKEQIFKSKDVIALGDIYISVDKAKEQAKEYGHSLIRELKFLYVHGLLHLLGYDHMNEEDEKVMFKLQDEILPRRQHGKRITK